MGSFPRDVHPGPPDPPRLCKDCDTRRYDHGVIHERGCPRHPNNRRPQPDPKPVGPRIVDEAVQALREGHDPEHLREIARRLLGRGEQVGGNPAFLLRVTPDASTSLGLGARVVFGPTAEQEIGRLGVGVYALYPERPARVQPRRVGREDAVAQFYRDVCERAERKMLVTGKLEGSHYAAMQEIIRERGVEITPTEEDDG